MHVIAKAGAIRRRIVLPEHVERRPALRRLERPGNDMDLGGMIFAQLAVRVGPGRVEIPQTDRPDAIGPLEVRERVLNRQLRLAVGVDRVVGVGLADGCLDRLAVGRTRRGKHEMTAAFGRHRLERPQRADDVIAVVAGRIRHRVRNDEPRREMHDGRGARFP